MKLSKNFCWHTFQTAAMHKVPSFYSDGFVYDIIYIAGDYMIANKRRLKTKAINKVSFVNTGEWMYDILEIDEGYMLANKRRPCEPDITTEQDKHIGNMPDGTPLFFKDGQYKQLHQRGNK